MHRIGPPVSSEPIAVFSDVHGNLPALDAVLEELARQAVTQLYVAGDLLLGGEEPREVWQRLQHVGARCVLGTSDLALVRVDPAGLTPNDAEEEGRARRFADTRRALGELVLRQLSGLPQRLRVPMVDGRELLIVHGSPKDPLSPIDHELDDEAVLELLDDDPAAIVACGATHVPFERTVDDVQVVNVGSVGEAPEGAYAHYTVIYPSISGARIEQSWVEYRPTPQPADTAAGR